MDITSIIAVLKDLLVLIVAYVGLLAFGAYLGVRSLVNLIIGLYIGLLFWMTFPFHAAVASATSESAFIKILFFAAIVAAVTYYLHKMFPRFDERPFERFGKKALYAAAGSILLMIFSFHILPVQDMVSIGSPIATLFGTKEYFFYWLIVPFLIIGIL